MVVYMDKKWASSSRNGALSSPDGQQNADKTANIVLVHYHHTREFKRLTRIAYIRGRKKAQR